MEVTEFLLVLKFLDNNLQFMNQWSEYGPNITPETTFPLEGKLAKLPGKLQVA